ncbi:MAG TPA: hypothetical protein EYH42_09395, partial [Sulfurovum sp.]|nr:hypothetical protein [Sulfurovum sp.]
MYFYHTSLSALSQDDIFSIMFYGGMGTALMITPVFVLIIYQFKQVNKNLNAPIISTIGKAMGMSIFYSILFLIAFTMFMTVYIGLFANSYSINPAEGMEWFLHTRWTDLSLELPYHLDAIEPYGAEAVEQARGIVGIIYLMYLALIFVFLAMNVIIFSYGYSTIGKMTHAQNGEVSGFEYASSMALTMAISLMFLSLIIVFLNGTFNEIFMISDLLVGTNIEDSKVHLEHLFMEIF